jgi:hypothetical protein
MLDVAIPHSSANSVTPPAQPAPPAETHMSFHDILSALNPLQYVPVIGTIYRAVTGDQIPEALRRIGSIIVGGLMGGPVGAAISVASIAVEKVLGIDLDKVGQALLTGGHPTGEHPNGDHPAGAPIAAAMPTPTRTAPLAAQAPPVPALAAAWSPAQLAAYGVSTASDGRLKLADLRGADVLNALELSHLRMVRSAYNQAASLAG